MPLTGFNCWPDPRLDAVTLKVNENSSFETGRADWATQPFVRVVTIAATEPNPSVGGRLWSPFSLSVGRVVTERVDTKSAMKNSKALRASQAQRSNARFLLIGKLLIPHDDGGRVSQLNECPSQPASASVYVCMWMWVYRRCQLRKNPEWANETSGTLRCRYCCSWWVSLARNVHWEEARVCSECKNLTSFYALHMLLLRLFLAVSSISCQAFLIQRGCISLKEVTFWLCLDGIYMHMMALWSCHLKELAIKKC